MRKNQLTRTEAHELLMQHKTHYLWNVPYNKWTAEDETNLLNGINKSGFEKQRGNRVGMQPIKMIDKNGTEKDLQISCRMFQKNRNNRIHHFCHDKRKTQIEKSKISIIRKSN